MRIRQITKLDTAHGTANLATAVMKVAEMTELQHTIYVYRYEDGTTQVKCDTINDLREVEWILQDAIYALDPEIGTKVEQQ